MAEPPSHSSTPIYVSTPLNRPTFSIRLLCIKLTDAENADWMLTVHELNKAPPFVALSYEWGTGSADRTIRLNGYDVLIRANLYQALTSIVAELRGLLFKGDTFSSAVLNQSLLPLHHLVWRMDRTIFLWIDALCIDQSCRLEREMQVANMGQIFSGAAIVLVWLGLHDEHSRELIRCLSLREVNTPESTIATLQPALIKVLNRSYWSRMWIVQEIYLAKELIAGCGDAFFQWDILKDYIDIPARLSLNTENGITKSKAWSIIRQRMVRGAEGSLVLKRRLDKNIIDFGSRECSDKRDRVYSLLSISWTNNPLSVDYSIDIHELFARVVDSIDWEDAAWRDSVDASKDFESLLSQLCQIFSLDQIPREAFYSVEAIKRQIKNEHDGNGDAEASFTDRRYDSNAKCTVS